MKTLMVLLISMFFFACASYKKTEDAATTKNPTAAKTETKVEAPTKSPPAAKTATASAGAVVCKSKADERQLEVVKPQGGGCEVHYTKFGTDTVVANAQNDTSYCEEVLGRIKTRLTESGFECN
ncbi:MAG: hypothetical protein IT288_13710 [Bdellovibrionales bacterium]|nr:hypothetical protein [Bdellovibrionales bacterium]